MKVLLVSADFPPVQSGEANHTFFLAGQIARAGHDVHVLTSKIAGIHSSPEFTIHPVMQSWTWRALPQFAAFVRRCSPDTILLIFLGSMYRDHPMVTFAATVSRFLRSRVRFVTQFEHLGVAVWKASCMTKMCRKVMAIWSRAGEIDYQYGTLLRDSHAIICLSEMHKQKLCERNTNAAGKSHVVPPPPLMQVGRNSQTLRQVTRVSFGVKNDEFLLVFYGYIYRGKGLETLFEALSLLRNSARTVRLLIVGGPIQQFVTASHPAIAESLEYFQSMKDLGRKLEIADRIIWAGPTPCDSEVTSAYLDAADACVLPFDHGVQLNNSSFAAAAVHRLPTITTRSETTEPDFRDGENVILCSPRSADELARALAVLIESQEIRDRLVCGIQNLADRLFSWESATRRTIEILSPGRFGQLPTGHWHPEPLRTSPL